MCERPFDSTDVLKHEEHIIQNAIGGKLRSDTILCEKCGETLGKSVDAPFISSIAALSSIVSDLARDRGDHSTTPAQLKTNQRLLNCASGVTFKLNSGFELLPSKPIYIQDDVTREVTVFAATAKLAAQFCNSPVIRELQADGYSVAMKTNIAEHAEKIFLQVDPESPDLLRGLLKIAIEYAISKGVAPALLKPLLLNGTVTPDTRTLREHVTQYYPTSDEEKLYEAYKFEHENWFPNHQLYLFSFGNRLYCYVELFGTIQKYILLSSDYRVESVREKYLQRCTKWNFNERDWICRSASDLDILARQFGIATAGRQWKEIQEDILNAARKREYSIDPDEQIEKVKNLVFNLAQYKLLKVVGIPIVDKMMEKAAAAKLNFTFELADKLQRDPLEALALLHRDFNTFRIGSESKGCADAANGIDEATKKAYASYKLFEFIMALDMHHVLEFKPLEMTS